MSVTPETDARTYGLTDEDGIHCEAVHAEFARNLERERDELRTYADKLADGLPDGMLPKDVENLRNANAGLAEDLHKAERERDTACRLLAQMHAAAVGEIQGPNIDPVTDILFLRKERDCWRECAESLIDYAHESLAELGTWGNGYERYERQMEQIRADIAKFERLMRGECVLVSEDGKEFSLKTEFDGASPLLVVEEAKK